MSEQKYVGIVIKISDYDEFDQIVTLLTFDEVIPFIARGVRKINSKNRVALQLGNVIEIELFRARLSGKVSKLKRANIIKQPPIEELDTANVLYTIIKHISKVEIRPGKVFSGMIESFDSFGTEFNHHVKVYILFKYLDSVGQSPMLNGCIECGTYDNINGFEFYMGGFTCNRHSPKKKELSYLKGIQALGQSFNKYKTTNAYTNKLIFNELEDFIKRSNW